MNIAVRYYSRGGNTKKVADAIAEAVGVKAKDCSVTIDEPVDLLFIGGSVYGFGLDDRIKAFIAGLNQEQTKNAALFGTSAIVKTGNQDMRKMLNEKGIPVVQHDFHCNGAFTVMHRGRPNNRDLEQAAAFALAVLDEMKEADV